ncbi:hypothetical protein KV557_00245 [Kitasatospora aureofaciens]|uniref:hypothetical protein n=1 Tax=Kitasatospora aureofaciens TaxID=1894 RepID=UPI001C46DC19|nr:hypothetical protein [Kitasatospora aureofaciens]MBV6695556.1 hypothetical protein [Kitasatospora aureofaciens]
MTPLRPPGPQATRLRAQADAIDELAAAVPGAYREQGLPTVAELLPLTARIGAHHQKVLASAGTLAGTPLADTSQRAHARVLADAGAQVGQALGTISRAVTMAARIHEVDGLGSTRAEDVRERAGRELNLALSRTRLALTEASDALRLQARSGRDTAALPTRRSTAALTRSAAAVPVPTLTGRPTSAALPPAPAPIARPHPDPEPAITRGTAQTPHYNRELTKLGTVFSHIAENLDTADTMPERPTIPTAAAVTGECENALTVLRHCSTRLRDLTATSQPADPLGLATIRAFRAGRAHAATLHRHLAHALDLAVTLDDTTLPGKGDAEGAERERRLGYQALCAVAEARNAAVGAAREILALSDQLPPAAPPRATPPRRPRTATAVTAAPAAGQVLATAAGRRR